MDFFFALIPLFIFKVLLHQVLLLLYFHLLSLLVLLVQVLLVLLLLIDLSNEVLVVFLRLLLSPQHVCSPIT